MEMLTPVQLNDMIGRGEPVLVIDVRSPAVAAGQIVQVIEALDATDTGSFVDYRGERLPW